MTWTQKTRIFRLTSLLLLYPAEDKTAFYARIEAVYSALTLMPESRAAQLLQNMLSRWQAVSLETLCEEYVLTFDFAEGSCLYLTAHEFGDNRSRGEAMVELHQMYRAGGFVQATAELPDYLPMLLEFLSLFGEDPQTQALQERLALMCHRVLSHMQQNGLFNGVFLALVTVLPKVEYGDETTAFPNREPADTDDLPYPLQHQIL